MRVWFKRQVHRIVPESIRASRTMRKLKNALLAGRDHQALYTDRYFQRIAKTAEPSAAPMAASIVADLKPARVIDVGCGAGALLDHLQQMGCNVIGLEYADMAVKRARARGLQVIRFDLESDIYQGQRDFDAVISMEVAEHLPARLADRFVDLLVSLGGVIVFTAATPGQGGEDHVNEQPHDYWIRRFSQRGYALDPALSDRWRQQWQASGQVAPWYCDNIMVFHHT